LTTAKASLPIWIGIAGSKLAARIAAELPSSPTIVPAGDEAAFLAPLPLHRLSDEADTLATLRRWGIRSIGELACLPKNEVASRLGDIGRILHQRARGLDPQPLVPYQPPPTFAEGMELEWPLVALEPFLFVARAALGRLVQRLTGRGLACARLEIDLRLEPDGYHRRSIQLPAPTRDAKTLLTLIRLELERQSPAAAVTGFSLTAHPDRPREAQLSLFGPPALSPDRLATTLAKLFAQLGPDRVGSPRLVDGHRPESLNLVEYHPPPPPEMHDEVPRTGRGLLAIRVLRPPIPLEVATQPATPPSAGPIGCSEIELPPVPSEVLATLQEGAAGRPRIQGLVRVASGPWSLEEEWWSTETIEREYWDIELERGGLFRIFRQRTSGEWFADGMYD